MTPTNDRRALRRRSRLGAIATLAALALVAAACGSTSSGAAPKVAAGHGKVDLAGVTLNIGDQAGDGSQALLTAAGLIHKLPFKVKWDDFTSGPPMLEAMASGSVDIGGVGDAPPVVAAAGGAKIDVVSAVAADPEAAAILVPKDSPIHSVSQLRGKKIAVAQGSSGNAHLVAVLDKAKIPLKDVTIDYLQPAAGLSALTSGAVDAWDVWSPYVEQVVKDDHARILVNGQLQGQTYSFQVASRSALASPAKADAIADYVKLLDQAYRWSASHPDAWAKTWAQATGLPLKVMDQAAKDDVEKPVAMTARVTAAEQALVDAFSQAGLIPNRYAFGPYVYTGFNRELAAVTSPAP